MPGFQRTLLSGAKGLVYGAISGIWLKGGATRPVLYPPEDVHARFRQRFYSPALADGAYEFEDLREKASVFWETAPI